MHNTIRYCIACVAALAFALSAPAQGKPEPPYKYEIGVSLSGLPVFPLHYLEKGRFTFGAYHDDIRGKHSDDYLEYIYGDHRGPIYGTGSVQFEGSVYLQPWLVSTLNVGIGQYWGSRIDNRTHQKTGNTYGLSLTFLPELRLILNRRHAVRFFSSIAGGTGFYMGDGFDKMRSYDAHPSGIHQRWELEWVPLGIMIGRKYNFFANFGIGSVYMGGRMGVSYRF